MPQEDQSKQSATADLKSVDSPVMLPAIQTELAQLRGVYANRMLVQHTRREFVLNFLLQLEGREVQLVSRVFTSPGHAKAVVDTLGENIDKYEERFGEIEPGADEEQVPERKQADLGEADRRLLAALVAANADLPLTAYRSSQYQRAKTRLLERKLIQKRRNGKFHLTDRGFEVFYAFARARRRRRRERSHEQTSD